MTVVYLSTENLLALAVDLGCSSVRDPGLLDSAAHRPSASVFGREAYPSIHDKAAALLESLVRNHPLIDGNKRLGWLATVVFYGVNGLDLEAPDDDAYELIIGITAGQPALLDISQQLAKWVR